MKGENIQKLTNVIKSDLAWQNDNKNSFSGFASGFDENEQTLDSPTTLVHPKTDYVENNANPPVSDFISISSSKHEKVLDLAVSKNSPHISNTVNYRPTSSTNFTSNIFFPAFKFVFHSV